MIFAEIESERGMSIFVIHPPHNDSCHSTIALLLVVFTNGEESTCLAHKIGVGMAATTVLPTLVITDSFPS